MSRDYKSRQSSASADSKGSLMLGIFIGFTLGIVSAIGIWFYLENAPSPFINEQQSVASDVASEKVAEKTDSSTAETDSKSGNEETTVTAVEPRTRFDFYDILSSEGTDVMDYEAPQQIEKPQSIEKPQEVARLQPQLQPETPRQIMPQIQPQPEPQLMISPSTPAAPQSRPSNPVAVENYYLQVGSFRSHAEADNLKARLAFLGMVASVQSVDLADRGVWYRVRVGPYMQKTQVDNVHVTLRENGIDAQLIKTR